MPLKNFKGVIRVKFINEQGLDEAGIDQDGVFKGMYVFKTILSIVLLSVLINYFL